MASASPSEVFLSTPEKENFQRIARLLICGGTSLLRKTFDHIHPPHSLAIKLKNPIYKKKLKEAKLTKPQWECLYPRSGDCGTSADFDISLLFRLLRTICHINPPATGWDDLPPDTDHCLSAELVRIRVYRNQLCHGYSNLEVSDKEFRSLWNDVGRALEGIARSIGSTDGDEWKKSISKLFTDPLTPDVERNVKQLKEWYKSDVAKAIKELEISFQGGIESGVQKVQNTISETTKETQETIKETMKETKETVKDQLKQTEDSMVKQLQKSIAEASLQSPGRVQCLEEQPRNLVVPDRLKGFSEALSAVTSGANQSSQATVQALEASTQITKRSSETRSTGDTAGLKKAMRVDQITGFKDVSELVFALGVNPEGHETMEKIKEKIRERIDELAKRHPVTKTFHVISEAGRADEHKRSELGRLYNDTKEVLSQLDDDFMKTFEKRLGDLGEFRTTIEENIKNLGPRDQYVVLVAGETSAGKSSVINLILGEEILPSAVLSTTSTIFELKFGEKPKVGLHFKGNDGARDPMYFELTGPKETYEQQIRNLVGPKKDQGKVSPFKKVELFWPHPLFEERVMIVDSPGVGESDDMNESVLNYLPRAFCFIYVINSTNAGGIQEDRLGMLLSCASRLKREAKMDLKLFASCALFVCNKWDEIKPSEVVEVQSEQIEKLTKKLGSFDPKSQIVYLSCKRAQKAQEYGVIIEDFDDLINGISNLIVSSMNANLQIYTSWLDHLLSRASRQIKILLKSTTLSRLEKNRRMDEIKKRMEELQSSHSQTLDELKAYQSAIIWEIVGKLAFYFKSEDTSKRFCEWSPEEVPKPKATWEETENEVLRCISERSQRFVQDWEDEEQEFATAQEKMIKHFCEKYSLMEEEVRMVEDEVLFLNEKSKGVHLEQFTTTRSQKRIRKLPPVTTFPVWLKQGLASVVIESPLSIGALLSRIKEKLNYQTKLQMYEKDPCAYMSRRSQECLKVISTQDRVLCFIETQLEDSIQLLRQMREKIPKLIEGDQQLYQQLLEDTRSKAEIQNFYEPLNTVLESLKQDVTVYTVKEIRRSDFTSKELTWTEHEKSIVGRGTFSNVYSGVLSLKGEPTVKVALKVYRQPLTRDNVWHFIDEEQALRQLRHPNLVKFYGTNLQNVPTGTRVVIVLELCKCSLKTQILSHPENAPARLLDEKARTKVLLWAMQILDVLRYAHGKGFVHQSLRMENVLLTEDENAKLTDISVGKFETQAKRSPWYLAPEILEGRIYDSKAEMYSFGLMLWEMWYGEVAFRTTVTSQSQHLDGLKKGNRPSHIEGTSRPWEIWQNVMESCWRGEPRDRLTAQDGWKLWKQLQKQQKTVSIKERPTPAPKPSRIRPRVPPKPFKKQ